MAESIAKGNIQLSADGTKLDRDLSSAEGRLKRFADAVGRSVTPDVLKKSFSATMLGSFVGSSLASLATSAVSSVTSAISHSIGQIRQESLQRQTLGFSQSFFAGLSVQAAKVGLDLESVEKGWHKYAEAQGKALEGDVHAEALFRSLGVSLEDLTNKHPEEVWKQIAKSMESLNPMDRLIASVGLFGARNARLGRVLMSGTEGLTQGQMEARRLGLALPQGQADASEHMVKQYTAAIAQIDLAWRGMVRGWMAETAPLFQMVADAVSGEGGQPGSAASQQQSLLQSLPRALVVAGVTAGEAFLEGAARLGQWTAEFLAGLGELIKRLPRVLGGGENGVGASISQFGTQNAKELASVAQDRSLRVWVKRIEAAMAAGDMTAVNAPPERRTPSQLLEQRGREFLLTLQTANVNFGRSAEEIERERLARAGLNAVLLRQIDQELERHAALELNKQQEEHQQKLREDAQRTLEGLRTPTETFTAEVARLQDQLRNEMIQPQTFQRGIATAFQRLAQTTAQAPPLTAAAKGSQEAIRILADQMREVENPQQAVRRAVEQALGIEREQLQVQRLMFGAILQQTARLQAMQAVVVPNPAPPAPPEVPNIQGGQNQLQQLRPVVPVPRPLQDGVGGGVGQLPPVFQQQLNALQQIASNTRDSVNMEIVEA